jgi:outer membrane protein assembly factor BamB
MYGHDPQRTSYNPDETRISAANVADLVQAWQDNIGINTSTVQAFSAPSVANGTVYVASSVSTGNNLFALDAFTGVPRWNAFIGFNPDECFGVAIGSTPAISDGVVAIGGGDGAYYGLNALTGSQLWRDAIDQGPSGFAWVSPLIANGRAYVGAASDCDNPSIQGEVHAVSLSTGSRTAGLPIVPDGQAGGGIWNSPTLSADGGTIFIATGEDFQGYDGPNTRALLALDPDTLEVRAANRQGPTDEDADWGTTPIVFHDSQGRPMVGAGHKDGTFYAYYQDDISDGPAWSWAPGPSVGMLPAYDPTAGEGGLLFIGSKQHLYALNASDGTPLWTSPQVGEIHGNFAVANGLVYVNGGGSLIIIDEATGDILRTITPDGVGPGLSGPVVSNGLVYWVSGAVINAWHLPPTTQTNPPACSPCAAPGPTEPDPLVDPPSNGPFLPCGRSYACPGLARYFRGQGNHPPYVIPNPHRIRRV